MNILLLLAIAGISFAIKQFDGPFNIFAKIRNLIARIPAIGPAFFKILTCDFCLGGWISAGLYILVNFNLLSINNLIIWIFAGAAFNLLFSRVMHNLNIHQN